MCCGGSCPAFLWRSSRRTPPLVYQYWVSVDSGLLVSAETLEEGTVVYRMTAYAPVQSPCPTDAQFQLPDGTRMHTVGETQDGG